MMYIYKYIYILHGCVHIYVFHIKLCVYRDMLNECVCIYMQLWVFSHECVYIGVCAYI